MLRIHNEGEIEGPTLQLHSSPLVNINDSTNIHGITIVSFQQIQPQQIHLQQVRPQQEPPQQMNPASCNQGGNTPATEEPAVVDTSSKPQHHSMPVQGTPPAIKPLSRKVTDISRDARSFVHLTVVAHESKYQNLPLHAAFYSNLKNGYERFKETILNENCVQNNRLQQILPAAVEIANIHVCRKDGEEVSAVREESFGSYVKWYHRQVDMGRPGLLEVLLA
ncbi:MAG: hypothetical protein Q9181_001701 [Wetmoreana brouardii]